MSLSSIDEIGQAKTLTPNSEIARLRQIRANRLLYNGNFTELGVVRFEEATPEVKANWFRRVANFYPEFMFGERPDVTIEGNERFTLVFDELARRFWEEVVEANIDLLRFGYGVIASHPENPLFFQSFDPEYHYEVCDPFGNITADLLLRLRGSALNNAPNSQQLDVFVYEVTGESRWDTYAYDAGAVGARIRTVELPRRLGRQVIIFQSNRDRVSIFEDMKPHIGEISRALTQFSGSIKRNTRPHLYGPAGAVQLDSSGKAEITISGMYFPIQEGDIRPGYIQWENGEQAIQYDIDTNYDNLLSMAALSRLLFDPSARTGILSGAALRRLTVPFVAKLNRFKEVNHISLLDLLHLYNRNSQALGLEVYDFAERDVMIDWHFEDIFQDLAPGEINGQESETDGSNDSTAQVDPDPE